MIQFFVPGIPAPGGSKRYVGRIIEDCKRTPGWRDAVASEAVRAMAGKPPIRSGVPITVKVVFHMPRPMGHYRKSGLLKASSPLWPVTRPDATKLWRSAEDALKGIVWMDDAQVMDQHVVKKYAGDGHPGVTVEVSEREGAP